MTHRPWIGCAFVAALGLGLALGPPALALPTGPVILCETYPAAPLCEGSGPDCSTCHTIAPARNRFGSQVSDALLPDVPRPLGASDFDAALPAALGAVEALDADGDGFSNIEELLAGSDPADPSSIPGGGPCPSPGEHLGWDPCRPDLRHTHRKLSLDFCGRSPSQDERRAFAAASDPEAFLDALLARCLDSEHWRGRDGVLWRLAHRKVKPVQSIKSGEGAGDIPLADYLDDYNLFVYAQTGDRDARELLTADYHVARTDGARTEYAPVFRTPNQDLRERGFLVYQAVEQERRAGMITTRWFLMSNTMFTGLPRTTAAQAYRAYLGYDLAKLEGLFDVPGEPMDHDQKGVDAPECARCHATLDPLSHPFSRYSGIGGEQPRARSYSYVPDRPSRFVHTEGPRFRDIPERGWLLGQPVRDLVEWAAVAANSDAFARTLVRDYWRLLIGRDPLPQEQAQFSTLWQNLRERHAYRVERMLAELVETEAYRVP